ncbi:MAG: site-specific integrase [Clostridium sp.]|nr:site-specific integrase [Clostridium sp.]MBS6881908.1 site-specific integrase [Clostridiaceae bacterium]
MDGIFSLGTMETYRAAMQPFAKWLSAHQVKNASQIIKAHAAAYLREREAVGLSFRTASRDMATINQTMGFDLNKKELGLRSRKKSEITRSREET